MRDGRVDHLELARLVALIRPLLPWWRAMIRTHDRMKGGR